MSLATLPEELTLSTNDELVFKSEQGVVLSVHSVCNATDQKITWESEQELQSRHSFLEFMPPKAVLLASLTADRTIPCTFTFTARHIGGSIHRFTIRSYNYVVDRSGNLSFTHRLGFASGDFSQETVMISTAEFKNYQFNSLPPETQSIYLACTFADAVSSVNANPFDASEIKLGLEKYSFQATRQYSEHCRAFAIGRGNILAVSPVLEVKFSPMGPQIGENPITNNLYGQRYMTGATVFNSNSQPMYLFLDLSKAQKARTTFVFKAQHDNFGYEIQLPVSYRILGFAEVKKTPTGYSLKLLPKSKGTVDVAIKSFHDARCTSGVNVGLFFSPPPVTISEVLPGVEDTPNSFQILSSSLLFSETVVWDGALPSRGPGQFPTGPRIETTFYSRLVNNCTIR